MLYAALLQCRMLDERLLTSESYERWAGREAATAGVAVCLRPGDRIAATRRSLLAGYFLCGCLRTAHQAAPNGAAELEAATSEALQHKRANPGHVTIVYTSPCEQSQMRRVFAAAAKQLLPAIFVLQGGLLTAETGGTVPVIPVDGSDAVAVYRVAHESIARASQGGGPTIIECAAWPRDNEHDALKKMESYLAAVGVSLPVQQSEINYAQAVDEVVKTSGLSAA
jgi:hypothetical protein